MKSFNVTAQVYNLHDPYKQNLLINQTFVTESEDRAIEEFKLHFQSIKYQLVKILSVEEFC